MIYWWTANVTLANESGGAVQLTAVFPLELARARLSGRSSGKTHRSFFLRSQSSAGSSPRPFLSSEEHQNMACDDDQLDLGFDGIGGVVLLSSSGYKERDGITVLQWWSPTWETGLKVNGTTRWCAVLSSEAAAGEIWSEGHFMGPFIGARVPVHSKQSFEAYLLGNQRSIRWSVRIWKNLLQDRLSVLEI
jgi:hypothetical protein